MLTLGILSGFQNSVASVNPMARWSHACIEGLFLALLPNAGQRGSTELELTKDVEFRFVLVNGNFLFGEEHLAQDDTSPSV